MDEMGFKLFTALAGSRAYGLEDVGSDYDHHTVFVLPTVRILSLGPRLREAIWREGEDVDEQAWELGHFLHLALQCNPTVLETFVAPLVSVGKTPGVDYWARRVRALFPHVLSRQRVFDAFQGYARNQQRKFLEGDGGKMGWERRWKFAQNWLRVLYQGWRLLDSPQTYSVLVPDEPLLEVGVEVSFRQFLREVRLGQHRPGRVVDVAKALVERMGLAMFNTPLPAQPDLATINHVLLKIRREFWEPPVDTGNG